MRSHKTYYSNTAFLDLLFNTLVGFVFLFIMAFLLITPQKKQTGIETKAEYIITLTWFYDSDDDVDIWLEDPLGNILFFREKNVGLMHLDRDDLGTANDKIWLPDGSSVIYEYNQEIVTIRGFIPGEWVLNVHMYKKKDIKPITVEVKMEKLNPSVITVIYKKFSMSKQWQEITIKRFILNNDGEIIDMNELPKKLVNKKIEMSESMH